MNLLSIIHKSVRETSRDLKRSQRKCESKGCRCKRLKGERFCLLCRTALEIRMEESGYLK
jgi:hypothetical protein